MTNLVNKTLFQPYFNTYAISMPFQYMPREKLLIIVGETGAHLPIHQTQGQQTVGKNVLISMEIYTIPYLTPEVKKNWAGAWVNIYILVELADLQWTTLLEFFQDLNGLNTDFIHDTEQLF